MVAHSVSCVSLLAYIDPCTWLSLLASRVNNTCNIPLLPVNHIIQRRYSDIMHWGYCWSKFILPMTTCLGIPHPHPPHLYSCYWPNFEAGRWSATKLKGGFYFVFLFPLQKGLQPLECAELGGHKEAAKLLQSTQVSSWYSQIDIRHTPKFPP